MELGQNLVETKNNNLIKVEFPFLYTYYKEGLNGVVAFTVNG